MAPRKKPSEKKSLRDIEKAERQIKTLQIPYDYDTKEYPIEVLLYKFSSVSENSTIIIPTYQRDFIWKDPMKSRFIESLFLGVPIQPLFAATLEDGTLEVIDGSQRLRTIEAFKNDEFCLSGLKKLDCLNGFYYSDFTTARKNKFGLINLRLHVITDKADLSIRQDIFDRVNTSGERAKPSEVRKGAFAGAFYEFIVQQGKDKLFTKLCPITENAKKRGEAEELILRFFTYSEYGTDNKDKGSRLFDRYVIDKNEHGFNPDEKRKTFESMLKFVQRNFPLGFKKSSTSTSTPRVRFEAISLGVYFALQDQANLVPQYMDWLKSKEFKEITTSDSSNNPGRLAKRVTFVMNCLLNKTKKDDLTYEDGERGF